MSALQRVNCACNRPFPAELKFAFQPIVDTAARRVFAQEALVRGAKGEGAGAILAMVDQENLHAFDRKCRIGAVKTAARLMGTDDGLLSVNTMPNSVYDPKTCLRTTIAAAQAAGFPVERIMFEMTEHEAINDLDHFVQIVKSYKDMGFTTAIDDFGAGSSGLNLFARVMPDIIKIDRALVDGLAGDVVKTAIVGNLAELCAKFSIKVIAEGIERAEDYEAVRELGIDLFQGYFFARPELEGLAADYLPAT